jgi:bifunctional enzyme CysN/CysC
MIVGAHDDEALQAVSTQERAARFSQVPTAIALTGANATDAAYQLERKLFDTGHASTVLETPDSVLINAIKNAGLLCLCVNGKADLSDQAFDTDKSSLNDIYNTLKEQQLIY